MNLSELTHSDPLNHPFDVKQKLSSLESHWESDPSDTNFNTTFPHDDCLNCYE